ncbi:MAG: c-type cytochrome [Azoarcus sp.]|jgi:cytochrome c553|nr:c-type cytochrome [Azoarcus sp.]
MIKRSLLLSFLLAAGGVHAQNQAVAPASAPPEVCATCHGADGNNWDPATGGKTAGGADSPKLAGQGSDYLHKQFVEFKNGARANNPVMTGMITLLPDGDMRAVAEYFAAQKPRPATYRSTDDIATGQKIWRAGIAARGVPACAACHGPAGKGLPAQYPALAGQFPEYIETQLKAFRDGVRANDQAGMMRAIALRMTDPEIKAVSDYAAALRDFSDSR